ncbi:MAG: SdpI family protein, partial [Nanoarchaeota archaeon]|nr:SdpI family protein [Nanoarchaeota archaeon]
IGHEIKHIKRNFFFGIRTPWALSSDHVWKKTHEFGSIAFKMNAVVILVGGFFERYAFIIFIASVLLNVLVIAVYSYIAYVKHGRRTDLVGGKKSR